MPFRARQFLLDGTFVEPEFGSDFDLRLLVAPGRQEDVAPLGWQGLKRVEHSIQSKPCARRALGMLDVPLTVTNQVAARPNGDGEGPGHR